MVNPVNTAQAIATRRKAREWQRRMREEKKRLKEKAKEGAPK